MENTGLERAVEITSHVRHRALRMAAIVGLAGAALAAAGLAAWLLYQRSTFDPAWGYLTPDRAEQSFTGRGLRLLTMHRLFVPGVIAIIGASLVAATLAVLMWRSHRWAALASSLLCAFAIVPPWIVRGQVWDLEAGYARSARWAARSPYVQAATTLSIGATLALGVIAALAAAAWLTWPRAAKSA